MALIKCKNCGKNISDKALYCPHCNFNSKSKYSKTFIALVSILVSIATFVLLCIVYTFLSR